MSDERIVHKSRVEEDRRRVVCKACPWFHYDAAKPVDDLRSVGRQHERNAREAEMER